MSNIRADLQEYLSHKVGQLVNVTDLAYGAFKNTSRSALSSAMGAFYKEGLLALEQVGGMGSGGANTYRVLPSIGQPRRTRDATPGAGRAVAKRTSDPLDDLLDAVSRIETELRALRELAAAYEKVRNL